MYSVFGEQKKRGGAKFGFGGLFKKKPSLRQPMRQMTPMRRPQMPTRQQVQRHPQTLGSRGMQQAKRGWKMLPPELKDIGSGITHQLQQAASQTGTQLLDLGVNAAQGALAQGSGRVRGALGLWGAMPSPTPQMVPQMVAPGVQQCQIAAASVPPAQQVAVLLQCLRSLQQAQQQLALQ